MPVITSYSLANSVSGALNTAVTAGDQARPTVVGKGSSEWFAAWESGGSVIHASLRDQNGAEQIAYGALNTTSPASDPEVAELTINTRIALVYTAGTAGATNIVGRVSSLLSSGDNFVADEFLISTDFTGPHTNADVARLGGTTDPFAVTWERQAAVGNRDIHMTVVLPNGTHPVPVVVTAGAADERDPHVAAITGGFVITWTTGNAVFAGRFNDAGVAQGGLITVDNSGTVNDQPQVTSIEGGGFAIVYRNNNAPGGSGNDITLARYDSAGTLLTSTLVNQFGDTAGNQSEPSITRLENGFLAIGYTDDNAVAANRNVKFKFFDENINVFGSSVAAADQSAVTDILNFNSARFVAAWRNTTADADGTDISFTTSDLVRTSQGDVTNDTINGDELIDIMTGDFGDDTLNGNEGNDILSGGEDNDQLRGGSGIDTMSGGTGNDTFIYSGILDLSGGSGESADGGAGTDKLRLSTSTNFSNVTLTSIEALEFTAAGTATFIDSQIGSSFGTEPPRVTAVTGAAGVQRIVVTGNRANLSELTFTSWTPGEDIIIINGTAGSDDLTGSSQSDTMNGGAGNDFYFVVGGGDMVIENVDEGTDKAIVTTHFSLPANVENLALLGIATLQGYGNDLVNTITGNTSSNLLDGRAGADIMAGDFGNDVYFVDDPGDTVTEIAAAGNDTVFSTAHFALSANVENLILQGGADLQGFGNDLVNTLYGNTGNNLLDGAGAADTMVGGFGNDTYFADNTGDAAFENSGEGNDAVFASAHYGLSANVEILVLQGSADLQGYGNNQANTLFGNTGNNLLNGAGDADLMVGGMGNDTYFADNTGDAAFENPGEGYDAVFASAHYGLAADVETLVLQGAADLQGYGNNQVNTLFGNTGNNLINGAGAGDTMLGGMGNDTYFVDNGGDVVVENGGEGADAVFSSVHFILPTNVETLVLQGGVGANGTGNALANSIFGNSSDNRLDGQGSTDTLTGNAGNDTFAFIIGQANGDTVVDFAGSGGALGNSLQFIGYGGGATFTQNDATHWQVNYNGGASHEVITFMNGAPIDASDVVFV